MIKKMINWFKDSDRYKHLIGGFAIGLFANGIYCAAYAGIGIASALEYKDHAHDCAWDWVDWGITVGGVAIGQGLSLLLR